MPQYQEGSVVETDRGTFELKGGQWVPLQAPQGSSLPTSPQQVMQQLQGQRVVPLDRQLGLTARAGVEGFAALPSMLAEIPRQALNLIPGVNFPPQQQAVSQLLSDIGLPQPETPVERIAGAGGQALSGAGGVIGAGKAISQFAPQLSQALTAAPEIQALSAGAGGVGGQTAAEMGAGPVGQAAAALGAGLVAPAAGFGVSKLFTHETPAKVKIAQLLKEGSGDIRTSKFKLKPTASAAEAIRRGAPKVQKDKVAIEAIKQGFDEGVIASVKGASGADKRAMLKMVDVMEKGKRQALYATENRPTDIVGGSFSKRLSHIRNVNQKSGAMLDRVAKTLRGKKVDSSPAKDKFFGSLDEMGIRPVEVDGDMVLDFTNSDIAGLDGPIRILNHVFNRMKSIDVGDAYEMHRLKRFISEHVSYGKTSEGLTGKAEIILKGLRRDIDSALDAKFKRYNTVNTTYSDTIDVLDDFQAIAGRTIDLTGKNADKAIGQVMRGVMSNNKSRVRLYDSVNNIEDVAVKYGGKYDDNLLVQSLFADELDSVFGPVARTSFQGQIGQAVERGARAAVSPREEAIGFLASGVEKMRGINQEGAFKSIKSLLRGK